MSPRRRQLLGLFCVVCLLAVIGGAAAVSSPDTTPPHDASLHAPPEHQRTPDQTFLTFPEWFLVYSPVEFADAMARGKPVSGFPWFGHLGQFWGGYRVVAREAGKFPFNGGYHLMIVVIGVSTTVEYTLRGIYEHTIGRIAEAMLPTHANLPEERFAAGYAQRYVDKIRVDPWYKFDFAAELRTLWSDVPRGGWEQVRRWERRYALTTELIVKAAYARIIGYGSESVYEAPKPVTAIVLDHPPAANAPDLAEFAVLRTGDRRELATVPRYQAFTDYAIRLAAQGSDLYEVAGNAGEILVSVLVPERWSQAAEGRRLLEQPVITDCGRKRVVLAVAIPRLGAFLRSMRDRPDLVVEHIYDF